MHIDYRTTIYIGYNVIFPSLCVENMSFDRLMVLYWIDVS